MKHYLKVYLDFVKNNFSVESSFRTSYVLIIIMDLFFYFSSLASISFIYDHVETIGPWRREELMFFVSFALCADHLHMTLLSQSFWELSEDMKLGNLDFILFKPISSLFIIFFRFPRSSTLFNAPIIWGVTIYYGLQVPLTTGAWIALPFLLILSFTLMSLIEFIVSTGMFWMKEGSGINFFRMQFQNLARWPDFLFSLWARRLFTLFIPILTVSSAPVHFMYEFDWSYLAILVGAILIMALILHFVWGLAIKQYDSASS